MEEDEGWGMGGGRTVTPPAEPNGSSPPPVRSDDPLNRRSYSQRPVFSSRLHSESDGLCRSASVCQPDEITAATTFITENF